MTEASAVRKSRLLRRVGLVFACVSCNPTPSADAIEAQLQQHPDILYRVIERHGRGHEEVRRQSSPAGQADPARNPFACDGGCAIVRGGRATGRHQGIHAYDELFNNQDKREARGEAYLDEAVRAGKLHKGDIAIMVAFGAGLTWANAVVRL